MKHTILFSIFLLLQHLAFSQKIDDKQNIIIGKIDSIQSKLLGEQRKIWVYVPDDAANLQRYPVVYVLDGDGHFSSVVGMIQQLSTGGNNLCPKMIVVGIPNTDRTRDLTPTHIDADPPFMDSASSKTSGGGENFIAFIEKELMPHIEAKYPTAPYKMFVGHSFGGLAVMQTFVHHNHLFNSYICIDPSMWWDNQKLLKQAQKVLAEKMFNETSFYLGIANTLEEGMDIKKIQKDTSVASKHIRSILTLQAAFEKNKQNGLKYGSKYYPDDTHGSVPLITEYDAFRFFFDFFPLKFSMNDYMDSTGALATKYQTHFANLSQKMGYQIKPDEAEINFIGYDFLNRKMYKTAESLFKLNLKNYPESFNVYDTYADFFIAKNDTANAILQLKKALGIKENPGSRRKLETLERTGKSSQNQKTIPSGFPVDCPSFQPLSKKEFNISPARLASDSLVKKAVVLLTQLNKENVLEAIAILEKAIAIDTANADAYYKLSSAYGYAPRFAGMLLKTGEEKSTAYFSKAFSLNPNTIDGFRGLANGMITYKNDYACAEKLLLHILELEPKNAYVRFEYSILVAAKNKFNEAYNIRETALADADSLTQQRILNNSSRIRFMAHDYDWVIAHCDKLITKDHAKTNTLAHFYKGLALAEQGKFEQALAEQKLATPSLKGDAGGVANLARAYILAGDITNGKLTLQEVLDRYTNGKQVVAYQIATVYEALGDFDNTFLWLNKTVDKGDGIHGWLLWLNQDPRWKRIRNDDRFKEIKVKAGL